MIAVADSTEILLQVTDEGTLLTLRLLANSR